MGYYSDVEATVKIDINKITNATVGDTVTTKGNAAILADTLKSLQNIYYDFSKIFVNGSFLQETFNEFVENGVIHANIYEMKMYDLTRDLKNFVKKHGDVIVYLDAERSGEENGDIERFEVRNVDGKNALFSAVAEMTFNYTRV